jgi:hypothetical protein
VLNRATQPPDPAAEQGHPRAPDPSDVETRAQVVAALEALVAREARLYMVMTRHSGEVFSYRRQMVDAFPEVPGLHRVVHVDRRPAAEHTFSHEVDRQFLEAGVLGWLRQTVGPR